MNKNQYHYAIKINHLLVKVDRVYFSAKGKRYMIYQNNKGEIWLENEDGIKCKLLYFTIDDNLASVITEGECKLSDDWTLLNEWK